MESSTLKLVMIQGPREGETLEFKTRSTIKIGRVVRGNNVTIKDNGISSNHLRIEFESGKWVIKDLDSSNGTILNDSKLLPSTTFDLRHGDSVKIGEYTSIKVEIEVNVDGAGENGSRLRRNPTRKVAAAVKDLGTESVGPSGANRGRRGGSKRGKGLKEDDDEGELGLAGGKCDDGLENAGSVAGNRGRRWRLKKNEAECIEISDEGLENAGPVAGKRGRGRGVSKKGEAECIEIHDEGLENAGPIAGNRGRRGGSNRNRALKEDGDESELGSVSEVHDEGSDNVGQVVESRGVRGGLRRGRSLKEKEPENVEVVVESLPRRGRGRGRPPKAKKMDNGVANGLTDMHDVPKDVGCDEEEKAPQVNLRMARSSKMEKGSDADPVLISSAEISGSKIWGSLKEKMNLQDEARGSDGAGALEENVGMNGLDSRDEPLEAAVIGTLEEKDNVEGVNFGPDTFKESASVSGAKESSDDMGMNGLDSRDEPLVAAAIGTLEAKDNVEGVNFGPDTFKESASVSGAKESSDDVGMNGLDSRDEPLVAAAIGTLEEKDNVEGVNFGPDTFKESASVSGAKESSDDMGMNGLDSRDEPLVAAAIGTLEEKDNVEGVNFGPDTFKESASVSGAKQSSDDVGMNGLDSRNEPLVAAAIGTLEEKDNVEGVNFGPDTFKESASVSGAKESSDDVGMNGLDSRDEPLVAAAIGTSGEKENVEGVNLGPDTFRESASVSGAKESSDDVGDEDFFANNVGDEVDLEKMTLGEWLDFLEVYLPKQIYDETEEMISKMEEKAKRFHEFMAQQQKDKGGLGRGVL